jgi:hypothetical protein
MYGFLKSGVKPFYIHDLQYWQFKDSFLLTSEIYFLIANRDSLKNEIYVYGLSFDSAYTMNSFRDYIDSSVITYFDQLPIAEKRNRIEKGFDAYSKVLRYDSDYAVREFSYESIYSPMRDEFTKYWQKTKDGKLLTKWFHVVELNDGSADGLDAKVLGKLFISFPSEFSSILNRQSDRRKKYLIYRLNNYGIYFATGSEDESRKYIKLLRHYTE